jgi:hypothetical protein
MKHSVTPLLLSILIFAAAQSRTYAPSRPDSLYDVFPLIPGYQYSYVFLATYTNADEMNSSLSQDSGHILYRVVDSTHTNDTLVLWNLQEIHDFSSTRTFSGALSGSDTSYRSSDTISLVLEEHILGKHEIKCSGIIWNSPFKHLRDQINVPIFRYAEIATPTLAWHWQNPPGYYVSGSGTDTLQFDGALGLFHRNFSETWSSGYLRGTGALTFSATHAPTTAVTHNRPIPTNFHLDQNYPNPFNPSTTICFRLKKSTYVTVKVFDLLGREVCHLYEGHLLAGTHKLTWNAAGCSTGTYYCRLQTEDAIETIKLLLLQ